MACYLRFHLNDGAFDGVRLLSLAGIAMLQTPHVHAGHSEFDETGDYHYGLGLGCHYYRGERAVGHDGGWLGWGTRMDMLPEHNLGVVVLTQNRQPSPVPEMLCHTVFHQVCGKPPIDWFDRFLTRRRQFLQQQRENRQVRDAVRRSGTRQSSCARRLRRRVHEHPGYGRIGIEAVGDTLHWRFRGLASPLAHRHYDVFEVPEQPGGFSPDLLAITFGMTARALSTGCRLRSSRW